MNDPRFGKVLMGVPWLAWLWGFLAIAMLLGGITIGRGHSMPLIIGGLMLAILSIAIYPRILRIPVVQTSDEGIVLRPSYGSGRVFYRWEDVQEVVIWYQRTGGDKSTMIGIRPRVKREPDNYGLFPLIKPNSPSIDGPFPAYVGHLVGKWSVHVGATRARKVAFLVSGSGKDIPVAENILWSEKVRLLTE